MGRRLAGVVAVAGAAEGHIPQAMGQNVLIVAPRLASAQSELANEPHSGGSTTHRWSTGAAGVVSTPGSWHVLHSNGHILRMTPAATPIEHSSDPNDKDSQAALSLCAQTGSGRRVLEVGMAVVFARELLRGAGPAANVVAMSGVDVVERNGEEPGKKVCTHCPSREHVVTPAGSVHDVLYGLHSLQLSPGCLLAHGLYAVGMHLWHVTGHAVRIAKPWRDVSSQSDLE